MDYKHAAFGIGTIFAGRIMTGTFKENGERSITPTRLFSRSRLRLR
jgi:hypothetical protein